MKKMITVSLILLFAFSSFAIRNWKAYTNTTHIFDVIQNGQKLAIATWGGLVIYNLETEDFEITYMTMDGLTDNDVRALNYVEETEILLIGTNNGGINRLSGNDFLMPISETLGLASKKVNKIIHKDSLIFVATKEGISVFVDNPELPFPFLLNNYSVDNGLFENNVTSLQITENNYLLCGSDKGLDYVNIDSLNVTSAWVHLDEENSNLPNSKVTSISEKNSKISIGTEGGLILLNTENLNIIESYEQDKSIFPVYIDEEQNLWFSYGYWDENHLTVQDDEDIAITKIDSLGNYFTWTINDLGISSTKIMGFTIINNLLGVYTWGDGILFYNGISWSNAIPNSIVASLIKRVIVDSNMIWTCNGYIPPPGSPLLPKGTAGVSNFDGFTWTNFNINNSPLISDNIYSMEVDSKKRKWFGAWYDGGNAYGWVDGISIYDDISEEWLHLDHQDGLRNDCISYIIKDSENNIWICSCGGSTAGINVLNENDEVISTFGLYDSSDFIREPLLIFFGKEMIFIGGRATGLRIYESNTIPETDTVYVTKTPFSDLHTGQMFAIDSRSTNFGDEVWIASSSGLFMYDDTFWYRYGTQIKKQVWFNSTWYDEMTPEYRYVEGQERLYGSVPTYPTALYVDPFGKIWIGTHDNGITIYQPEKDKFTNYNMNNSPLLSNSITDFDYEKFTGTLYIGTSEGLNSVEIGIAAEANLETKLYKTRAFPNPFHPDNGDILKIENISSLTMPKGNTFCNIYDLSGDLVIKLEKDIYEQFSWNGKNKAEKNCSSGIYFYIVFTSDGQISKGKIALIR